MGVLLFNDVHCIASLITRILSVNHDCLRLTEDCRAYGSSKIETSSSCSATLSDRQPSPISQFYLPFYEPIPHGFAQTVLATDVTDL